VDDRKSEDYRSRGHHVSRCQILSRCLTADSVSAVALEADVLRVDVIDVHDVAELCAGRLGIQRRLVPRRGDCPAASLSPQVCLGGDIEVDSLDLVGPVATTSTSNCCTSSRSRDSTANAAWHS
jgi:hypothetical protein